MTESEGGGMCPVASVVSVKSVRPVASRPYFHDSLHSLHYLHSLYYLHSLHTHKDLVKEE